MKFNIPKKYMGYLYIAIGLILFLHTLGIITTGLNYAIVIGSLILMGYGLVDIYGIDFFKKLYKKNTEE